MKKNLIILFAILTVTSMALVGCGDSDSNTSTNDTTVVTTTTKATESKTEAEKEEKTEAEENVENTEVDEDTDSDLQQSLDELAAALDGTMWVGTDADTNIYALAFNGTEISINYVSSDGSEGTLNGYWAIGTDSLYVYADEEMTEETTSFSWDFEEYNGNNLIYLDNACLTQTSADEAGDLATAISQMNVVNSVISYVADGTYWVAVDDTTASFFAFDGTDIYLYVADVTTGEEVAIQGVWGLDYDTLYIVDNETGAYISYGWDIAGDGSEFQLIDETDGSTLVFTQTDADSTDTAYQMIQDYLAGDTEEEAE